MDSRSLLDFAEAYDKSKYPFGIYKDLVIDGKASCRRFELMGAWKTGCIRIQENGSDYQDSLGNHYSFTRRWAAHTPVGYSVWRTLDATAPSPDIPTSLGTQVPVAIADLANRRGFGFIWALFAAHVCKPSVYPLYDQHVWRAFRSIAGDGTERPESAPNEWPGFLQYSEFFKQLRRELAVPYWKLDQALWVYGKSLKKPVDLRAARALRNTALASIGDEFAHSLTLGLSKAFWWFIDERCDICIGRTFSNGVSSRKVVCSKLVGELFRYLSDRTRFPEGRFPLAHNVEKLGRCSEVPGIGKFLYQNGFSTTESQLASHLAAIFYGAGIWDYNGKKRGQIYSFSDENSDWCKKVGDYYVYLLQSDGD